MPGIFIILVPLLLLQGCATPIVKENGDGSFVVSGGLDPGYYLEHNGISRNYFLHLPKDLGNRKRVPLVIMLHSAMGNGRLIAQRTDLNTLADREGFIAVYPNGSGWDEQRMLTWNSGHCCFYAREKGMDDVGFIAALLDRLQRDYPIDSRRVYVAGFSNGGMLAYRLAAVLSDRIAAIAAISANIGGQFEIDGPEVRIPEPMGPVSVLVIHGMKDEQVAFDGGRGLKTRPGRVDISVADSVAFWHRYNRCSEQIRKMELAEGRIVQEHHRCPATATDIMLYALKDGGHAWPGGEKVEGWSPENFVIKAILDDPSMDLDATAVIWNFFKGHRKVSKY
jgi:polyhydroxybutyrate depolymerase